MLVARTMVVVGLLVAGVTGWGRLGGARSHRHRHRGDSWGAATNIGASPVQVTQHDFDHYLRQGELLANSEAVTNFAWPSYDFASPAQRLFFTSKMAQEAKTALINSKATLYATKLLRDDIAPHSGMSANSFISFLESLNLKTSKAPRTPFCLRSSQRTQDGSCNNPLRPLWGAANTAFTRLAPPHYQDGLYAMPLAKSGNPLPSPRLLSSFLFPDNEHAISRRLTNLAVHFGQFVAHDISLRALEQTGSGGIQCCRSDGSGALPPSESHPACAPIAVPHDDRFYAPRGVTCLNFVRSATAVPIDGAVTPAQQINTVSSYLDGSPIYSTKATVAISLRTYVGGKLKSSPTGFLPPSQDPQNNCDCTNQFSGCPCYMAGDGRANQTPLLAALQTLWMREHNRVAEVLQAINPHWGDERVFQETRKIVVAQLQHITYHEWLPLCIGRDYVTRNAIAPVGMFSYDHDSNVNPGVMNEFAAAAFRAFHTMISPHFIISSTHGRGESRLRLSDHLFKPEVLELHANGFDALLRGAMSQPAMEADAYFTSEVTNFLFKSKNETGLDLAAMDIQRGRDHGLVKYNDFRTVCGLKRANNFDELMSEIPVWHIHTLKQLYEHVDDIDLFVGGMLEVNTKDSLLGPTFQCIVGEQFYRTRVGDRFFYDVGDMEHSFSLAQIKEIKKTSLARIICDNSDNIGRIQRRVFEVVSADNTLLNCLDTNELPYVNLMQWKEF